MALTRSFPTQVPSGQPITDTRRTTAGLVARNADGTPRAGVFPSGTTPIVTGRASMGYDIAPFLAATSRINTGVELIANDAVTLLAPAGYAAPSANSRIDVIWVRSQFMQHADTNNDVVFGLTQGTAAPVPTKPTIPQGALELATAEILSTTTTTATVVITQTHPFTAAAGGTVWMRNAAEMAAWAAPNGAKVLRLDIGFEFERVGGAWVNFLAKTPVAIMRRTSVALAAATGDYRNIAATAAWTATGGQLRGGMTYNNGIIVPIDGWYEVWWALRGLDPAPATIVGIAVNKDTGVGGDDMWAIGHMLVNIVTVGSASAKVKLSANDKLILFAYASSGTTTIVPNPSAGKAQTPQWGARWVEPV